MQVPGNYKLHILAKNGDSIYSESSELRLLFLRMFLCRIIKTRIAMA